MEDMIEVFQDFITDEVYFTCPKCKQSIGVNRHFFLSYNITPNQLLDILVSKHLPCYNLPINAGVTQLSDYQAKASERYSFGMSDPRKVYGMQDILDELAHHKFIEKFPAPDKRDKMMGLQNFPKVLKPKIIDVPGILVEDKSE